MPAATDATSHCVSSSMKLSGRWKPRPGIAVQLPEALHPALHFAQQYAVGKLIDYRTHLADIVHRLGTRIGEHPFKRSGGGVPSWLYCGLGGSSRSSGSSARTALASTRNPSISRLSQKRSASAKAWRTSRFCQSRSGCSFRSGLPGSGWLALQPAVTAVFGCVPGRPHHLLRRRARPWKASAFRDE